MLHRRFRQRGQHRPCNAVGVGGNVPSGVSPGKVASVTAAPLQMAGGSTDGHLNGSALPPLLAGIFLQEVL